MSAGAYVGRFAPSPTGALHAGSMVAALASWLDARAHRGRWLVRIEDVDTPRCVRGATETILTQLAACALVPDAEPWRQSARGARYQQVLDALLADGRAFGCACSRSDVLAAIAARGGVPGRGEELIYPGTCRAGTGGRPARSVRLRADATIDWTDRRLGPQRQDVRAAVGDFVLRRADGLWAYQLAVVVDDADQGITHVVRGEDLADNTPRQILLQRCLDLPTPHHMHTPLVMGADGQKLSKQNGALALDVSDPLRVLRDAGRVLGLDVPGSTPADWLSAAVAAWPARLASWLPLSATKDPR